jgi:hypothetical protein
LGEKRNKKIRKRNDKSKIRVQSVPTGKKMQHIENKSKKSV